MGVDRRGRLGVKRCEPPVHLLFSELLRLLCQPGADRVVRRLVEKADPLKEGGDVKPGTAGDNRQRVSAGNLSDRLARQFNKLRHAEPLRRVTDINEVVRCSALFLCCRLRSADVETAVDLHRISREDLPTKSAGEMNREIGLAGGGRPEHHNQFLLIPCGQTAFPAPSVIV